MKTFSPVAEADPLFGQVGGPGKFFQDFAAKYTDQSPGPISGATKLSHV